MITAIDVLNTFASYNNRKFWVWQFHLHFRLTVVLSKVQNNLISKASFTAAKKLIKQIFFFLECYELKILATFALYVFPDLFQTLHCQTSFSSPGYVDKGTFCLLKFCHFRLLRHMHHFLVGFAGIYCPSPAFRTLWLWIWIFSRFIPNLPYNDTQILNLLKYVRKLVFCLKKLGFFEEKTWIFSKWVNVAILLWIEYQLICFPWNVFRFSAEVFSLQKTENIYT